MAPNEQAMRAAGGGLIRRMTISEPARRGGESGPRLAAIAAKAADEGCAPCPAGP